ncbi:MAG: ABC transporter permease [Saprospiraceae bacterium]
MVFQILKINLRKLLRDRGYSLTNILGLTLGMTAFVMISLWVKDELTFDGFHEKAEETARVVSISRDPQGKLNWAMATTPWLLAPALEEAMPEVKGSARVWRGGAMVFEWEGKPFLEKDPVLLDPSFFDLFDFEAIQGDRSQWLSEPNKVVLSATTANKMFGEVDPMGQSIVLQDSILLTVSGIMEDMPSNSSFNFPILLSAQLARLFKPEDMTNWGNWNFDTYLWLDPLADRVALGKKITDFYKEKSGDDEDFSWVLQGVKEMHLYSNFEQANARSSQVLSIYYLLGIGFLVLIIACINYTNLATARANKQTKSVSIRKIVGASRQNLFSLFLGESILLTVCALLLSICLLQALFPWFNEMTGKRMTLHLWEPEVIGILLLALCLTILISGIYPATLVSSFSPLKYLQGINMAGSNKSFFRHVLLVGQFAITAVLVTGTVVIFRQLNFLREAELGYAKENIFTFELSQEMRERPQSVKDELLKQSNIAQVTLTNQPIYQIGSWTDGIAWPGHIKSGTLKIRRLRVDPNFFDFFGVALAEGDFFTSESTAPTFLINETAREALGMEAPIGEQIILNRVEGRIVGLVKDFHIRSLREKIEPLIIQKNENYASQVFIKADSKDMKAALLAAAEVWKTFEPKRPFEYSFLDEAYAQQYLQEARTSKMLNIASLLCIVIALIGLLGLVAFVVVQRTKEIGIRKVLGATAINIVGLLSRDFLQLVGIGVLIAFPLAWYFLQNWLGEFAYRIELDAVTFLLSGLFILLMALLVLSFHALRAALSNPIAALRYE